METKKNIIYVDDEPINLELFKINFKNDFQVFTAHSAAEGLKIIEEHKIMVVISDLRMPEMSGLELIEYIKERWPQKVCMLLTAYLESDVMLKAINQELIFRYITKPWRKDEVHSIIEAAFAKTYD